MLWCRAGELLKGSEGFGDMPAVLVSALQVQQLLPGSLPGEVTCFNCMAVYMTCCINGCVDKCKTHKRAETKQVCK